MNSFNFLPARPDRRRMLLTIAAVLTACGGVLAVDAIAQFRREALRVQTAAYEAQARALRDRLAAVERAHRRAGRMQAIELRVAEFAASGSRQAAHLRAIGNALPAHVWLTELESNAQSTRLRGLARNFTGVASALARLRSAGEAARLQSAMLAPAPGHRRAPVEYAIVLEQAAAPADRRNPEPPAPARLPTMAEPDETILIARFLTASAVLARREHCALTGVMPQRRSDGAFSAQTVRLTFVGRFGDALRYIARLSQVQPLIEIRGTLMQRVRSARPAADSGGLEVTVEANVLQAGAHATAAEILAWHSEP